MHRLATFLCCLLVSFTALAQQQVVFSEVMYEPAAGKPEFIEIWNLSNTPIDIEKWKFTEGIEYQFPNFNAASQQAHILRPQERIVVSAADAATTRAAYPTLPGSIRIFGPWLSSTALNNNGERITLVDRNGVVAATLNYEQNGRWPLAAAGTGHSLVLANDNRAIDDWRQWRQSVNNGGSPGLAEPAQPATGLVISEYHFSPTTGRVDWVELRNNGTATANADGMTLVGSKTLAGGLPLSGSVAPGEYISFDVDFAPNADGEISIFLFDGTNRVRSAAASRRMAGRDSWQTYPAGESTWYSSPTSTRGAANDPPRNEDIVINEIMADPPSNQRDGEFIELYNRGAAPVNLSGWKFDEGVDFTFPPNTTIAPGAYLVICGNKAHVNAIYPNLNAIGDWNGSLGNNGENIRLVDQFGNLVDEVDYRFGGEWPELASGNGSSLELVNPLADNRFGGAWMDSDESQKSAFQTFTINGGTYLKGVSNGSPSPNDDEIRIWGVSDMHIVLRNIVLRTTTGSTTNILTNAGVTTLANNNLAGWQARGTHAATFHDAEGIHLIAASHGDNKCNHIEKDAASMLANTQYTLTFEARWVYGKPRIIAQSWDTSWGGTVRVPIPSNLGTPGAQNSRYSANPPIQITSLLHSPPVPTSSATVTVTARISATTPLTSVEVVHRRDNISATGTWNSTAMNDAGTGGDVRAGDGIWTGQIAPASFGYNSGGNYIAEFYVRATAANSAVSVLPRYGAAMPGLWATDSQSVPSDLRRMRIVISQYWIDSLNQDSASGGHTLGTTNPARTPDRLFNYKYPRLSNLYVPCTFISNENDIYYASTVRKTGSPWTRQTDGNLTRGRVIVPSDRPFRGKVRLYWDNDSGATMLHNRVVRYWLYLFGVPGNQNEVCRVTRNADAFTVRETSEAFDKDMLERIWPNGNDGQFYELDDKFWVSDDGSTKPANQDATWGYKGLDAQGIDNPTWYQNQFIPKSREVEYDYSGLIEWMKQLQSATISQEACERMADTQAMTALAAVRGYIGDWDNITINRGKNGYMYQRSTDRKWMLMHWDSDLAFQNTSEAVLGSFPGVSTYFGRPFVRRYLNYYLTELLNNYSANSPRLTAYLAAEENASTAYSANAATYQTWSSGRVGTVQGFIGAAFSSTFNVTSPTNNTTTAADTINAVGTAPSSAFSVICVDHPEAVLTWGGASGNDPAGWTLSGIRLKTGTNSLVFRMLNFTGTQVGTNVLRTYTKSTNASPVMAIAADQSSDVVTLGEGISFDASGSYDPDGSLLQYSWTVSPNTGVSLSYPVPGRVSALFTVPGVYMFSVQATSESGATASITREVLVCAAQDYDQFDGSRLATNLTPNNTELLDNYSPDGWYSLSATSGNLSLQITETASRPLTAATIYPHLTRPLPASNDFVLQTKVGFETRFFGSFYTGLLVETTEGGQTVRYTFGLDGGTNLVSRKATGAGAYAFLSSQVFPGPNASGTTATLRIKRTGTQLLFQRQVNGVWSTVTTVNAPADTVAMRGGLFASTTVAQSVRLVFDYLALADTGPGNELVGKLRITELMYNPAGAGGVEFIELKNIGSTPLNLGGAYFVAGSPFDLFTFPDLSLPAGGYCVVTNNIAGFQALYGTGVTIAGQYSGSLNNAGERIILNDVNGNTILDFSYGDSAPWPEAADGLGKSIEIRDPANDSSYYAIGDHWIASSETGGSPGYRTLAIDSDGDGQGDTYELVFGSSPADPASFGGIQQMSRGPAGETMLTWSSLAGRGYTVECCDDLALGIWTNLGTVNATGPTATYTDSTATNATAVRVYRIRTAVP